VSFDLPEAAKPGDRLRYKVVVSDAVMQTEFINEIEVEVSAAQVRSEERVKRTKSNPPGAPDGNVPDGNGGIAFPEVIWVGKSQTAWKNHFQNDNDCLTVVDDGEKDGANGLRRPVYRFYMNEDNRALLLELRGAKDAAPVIRKQYEVASVLVGLALIHDSNINRPDEENGEEDDMLFTQIKDVTRAVAPFLIPMIQSLGELDAEDLESSDMVGQAA
jgi:hypothetical protein